MGQVVLDRFVNYMTQTLPNPLRKNISQPNSTHQSVKTNLTRQFQFWQVSGLVAHPNQTDPTQIS